MQLSNLVMRETGYVDQLWGNLKKPLGHFVLEQESLRRLKSGTQIFPHLNKSLRQQSMESVVCRKLNIIYSLYRIIIIQIHGDVQTKIMGHQKYFNKETDGNLIQTFSNQFVAGDDATLLSAG